jgi:hypothetical protein
MISTPVLPESSGKEETHVAAPHGVTVGIGVLWIVGAAAAWNVVLVLFHNLMVRLLW